MRSKDKPFIHYINMGPWPVYVGITLAPKAFAKEAARLGIPEQPFLGSATADATTHFLDKRGETCIILALPGLKRRTKESYAALVAHEAVHVVQGARESLAQGKHLGDEAEAYLVQYITQEALQIAFASKKTRRVAP